MCTYECNVPGGDKAVEFEVERSKLLVLPVLFNVLFLSLLFFDLLKNLNFDLPCVVGRAL